MAGQTEPLSGRCAFALTLNGYVQDFGARTRFRCAPTSSLAPFNFGKAREMGLGSLNTVDMATASGKGRECRQMLEGTNPLASRRDARTTRRFTGAKCITVTSAQRLTSTRSAGAAKIKSTSRSGSARLRPMRVPLLDRCKPNGEIVLDRDRVRAR